MCKIFFPLSKFFAKILHFSNLHSDFRPREESVRGKKKFTQFLHILQKILQKFLHIFLHNFYTPFCTNFALFLQLYILQQFLHLKPREESVCYLMPVFSANLFRPFNKLNKPNMVFKFFPTVFQSLVDYLEQRAIIMQFMALCQINNDHIDIYMKLRKYDMRWCIWIVS